MIFMVCSTVFTVLLLIFTLLNCWIRTRLRRESTTGSFIDRITGSFSQSRVAELILAADYLELSYKVRCFSANISVLFGGYLISLLNYV